MSNVEQETLDFAGGQLRLTLAPIAVLEFCQPRRRNAVTLRMWEEMPEVLRRVSDSELVRVLLVRGTGTEAFCAGADITEFERMYATEASSAIYINAVRTAQHDLRHIPQPVIAWIYGDCVGSGCGLALACDLRFAASNARFGIPPAKLGLAYSVEDTAQLVEKVGPAMAKDLLFSARLIDARQAATAGLVDRVVSPEKLESTVLDYAHRLAELSQVSQRASKKIINAICDSTIPSSPELREMYASTFTDTDMREGYEAFLSRRKPVFWNKLNGESNSDT